MFTIGLVLHPTRSADDSIAEIRRWAEQQGTGLVARAGDAERAAVPAVSDAEFARDVDAVVSLGGDGTMLGALRILADRPVPVLGVNHGHLGFLVDVRPEELTGALARIVARDFAVESHHALRLELGGPDVEPRSFVGFNDVVLARPTGTTAVAADLEVGSARYGYYRADAVVVATPTGSTAYSYAAGGPVVSPSAPALVVTPVAPMSGISRSLVFGPTDVIGLRAGTDGPAPTVEVDGIAVPGVGQGPELRIRLQLDAGLVVRTDAARQNARRRVTLSLLDLPLRPDQLLELVPPEMRARSVDHAHSAAFDRRGRTVG